MTTVMLAQLTVMLPHAQTPPANAEASNAIASLTERLADATGTAGKDLLASLLADDYVRVAPNGTFVGKAQIVSALGQSSAVRYGSPKIFIFGSDVAVTVAVGSEGDNGGPDPWIAARVFQKRSESWRVIAEDIRPAATPVPEPGTRPTAQPAALPPRGIEDTEVRRAVEAWRVATDPEAQRSFGRVQDSRAILDGLAEEYVRVRRDPNLTLETKDTHRAQFDEVDRTGKAVAPGHQWANAPNASLRFENVNVAVFGTVAVVTWRTIVNGSDRAPAYSVFRVYQKSGDAWRCVFGI